MMTDAQRFCNTVSQSARIAAMAAAHTRKRAPRVASAEARTRIIDATNELLKHRRFRDLTVEEVTEAAGLTRTTFYRHFDSISSIVLDLWDNLLAAVAQRAEARPATDRSILRDQLEFAVETIGRYGPLFLAFDDAAHHDDQTEAAYRAWQEHTVDVTTALLDRGVALGHTPGMHTRAVARALAAMNRAFLLELIATGPDFDREAAVDALWTVWSRTTWPE